MKSEDKGVRANICYDSMARNSYILPIFIAVPKNDHNFMDSLEGLTRKWLN